jgi:mono/diheme cytochrome c family protein
MKGVAIFAAAACLGAAAAAQETGNPDAGRALAVANCSQCHNVEPGGAMKLFPPSFAAIAAYMHPDIIPLRIMYPEHAAIMPQFHTYMNTTNLADLVAYIRSLDQ